MLCEPSQFKMVESGVRGPVSRDQKDFQVAFASFIDQTYFSAMILSLLNLAGMPKPSCVETNVAIENTSSISP